MQYVSKSEFLNFMQEIAPRELAESFDNVGMLIDAGSSEYKRALLALDLTPIVAQEAIDEECDIVITHHPIFFEGIKRLSVFDPETQAVCMLLRHSISHFAAHTNLDSANIGTNSVLTELLELRNVHSLSPKNARLKKVAVFTPEKDAEQVMNAMCEAGAGKLGNYSHCTFSVTGEGTFLPESGSDPYIGSIGRLERVQEIRLEAVVPEAKLARVIDAMMSAHPYEEVAYDVYQLDIFDNSLGLARIGELGTPMRGRDLCALVKEKLGMTHLRVCGNPQREIKTLALCAGSGASMLGAALSAGADAFLTGDVKHSAALSAQASGIFLIDAGHYETEKPAMNALIQGLQHRFNRVQYKTEFVLSSRETAAMVTL